MKPLIVGLAMAFPQGGFSETYAVPPLAADMVKGSHCACMQRIDG